LSKQTYPAKDRADPERAQRGSGVARPLGRPGDGGGLKSPPPI